ncbi:hypothetical protein JNUCC64_28130 [Streptomyces sp. JNUCC 64]
MLLGAALVVAMAGAGLALVDRPSPLRAPLVLFFLVAAPGAAFAAVLRGVDPWSRAVVSVAGALAVDLLVAQGMLALGRWSMAGGIVTVAALSSLTLLLTLVRRPSGRPARRRTP